MDGYCCPELKWVGLHTADVQLLETPTAETPGRSVLAATSFQPYSDRDGAIVDGLLRNPVRRALCYPCMPTACHPFRDCGQILVFPTRGVWGSEAEGLRGRPFSFTHCGANKACSVAVPGWASPGSLSVNGHGACAHSQVVANNEQLRYEAEAMRADRRKLELEVPSRAPPNRGHINATSDYSVRCLPPRPRRCTRSARSSLPISSATKSSPPALECAINCGDWGIDDT